MCACAYACVCACACVCVCVCVFTALKSFLLVLPLGANSFLREWTPSQRGTQIILIELSPLKMYHFAIRLTLKAPITTKAEDNFDFFFIFR